MDADLLGHADKALAWPRFRCCRQEQQGDRRALHREGGRRAVHSENGDGRASTVDASWEGRGASGLCRGAGCPANEALGRLWYVAVEEAAASAAIDKFWMAVGPPP